MPYIDAVYRTAMALCARESDAQDLVQTTYLKAMESFATFKIGTNCKAWLLQILRNTWIDLLRRQKLVRFEELSPQRPIAGGPQEEQGWSQGDDARVILQSFSDQQVIGALKQLPEDQRFALLLSDVEDLDQAQVARVLDVPVGTVKSRISRARGTLRQVLWAHARDLGFVKR